MDGLPPPKALVLALEGNFVENWRKWKLDFAFYMTAAEFADKADNVKSSLLLHCMGDKAREVYHTLTFVAGEEMIYNKVVEKFDEYFIPRKNYILEI